MKGRHFNATIMPRLNEQWTGKTLGMGWNDGKGPDLIDDKKIVEVKFTLLHDRRNGNYRSWRVLEHQLNYSEQFPNKNFYFALGTYQLDRPVSEVPNNVSCTELEKMVQGDRVVWMASVNWVKKFEVYTQRGKTTLTEWANNISFPKATMLPRTYKTFNVEGGIIHLTGGVHRSDFEI